jgi:hypothetical protein
MARLSDSTLDFHSGKCAGILEAGGRTITVTPEFVHTLISEIFYLRAKAKGGVAIRPLDDDPDFEIDEPAKREGESTGGSVDA